MKPKLIIIAISLLFITALFTSNAHAVTTYDWKGGTSTDWGTSTNWSPNGLPTSSDIVQIGVVSFSNPPTISTTGSCASLTFGTAASSIALTVNGSLSVTGVIMQNPPTISLLGLGGTITSTITGSGSVTCGSMQVGSTTFLSVGVLTTNQITLVSNVNSLQINGDLSVYGTANSVVVLLVSLLQVNNSAFSLRGGTTTISGQIYTNTTAGNNGILNISLLSAATANFSIDEPSGSTATPRLVLTNAIPIKSTSNAASIDFYNNTGGTGTCTVEYAGSGQTVYTESTTQLDISPTAYQNIRFSATGTKTISTGDLTVYGDWNSASTSGKVDASGANNPNVIFKGVTQSLVDDGSDAGKGVVFKNVFVQGSGTKTMSGAGKFSVSSTGILTMAGTATLNAGGILTLISDASGSATVASIPATASVTGNVNVQRYINGGALVYRGYRLLTSPVNNGSGAFTLPYLIASSYVTGTTKTAGGFDASPNANNPSIYFFRENTAYSGSSFTTGNFRGVNNILSSPYAFDNESGTFTLYSGNAFLFFFRGDRSSLIAQATVATHVPENTTFTASGTLNQGTITVKHWYTGTTSLLYSTTTGSKVQGYNLVGNPYASTINFEKFNRKGVSGSTADPSSSIYISGQKAQIYTTTTANIPPLVYIWVYNPTSKQYETYQQKATALTLPADTSTNINPGIQSSPGGAASNMIASGQGFFIRATGSSQTLVFKESAKTSTQPNSASLTQAFSTKVPQVTAATQNKLAGTTETATQGTPYAWPSPVLWLKLVKDSINSDGVAIVFVKGASAAYDANKDAEDLGGNGALESLSVLSSDSVKTAIHRRPIPGKQQQVIPLFVDATTTGLYKLSLTDMRDMPKLYEVWLKDKFVNDSLEIKLYKDYNFTIDKGNPASFGANRFQLIVRQTAANMVHLLNFNAKKASDGSQISWLTENEANYTTFIVERSTNNGQTFDQLGTIYSDSAKTYSLLDAKPLNGLNQYRLAQIDLNGDTTYSKIIPLMYEGKQDTPGDNIITMYPNPAVDVINTQMQVTSGTQATYKINITDSQGRVMAVASTTQSSWKNNIGNFLPGTYIMQVTNSKDNSLVAIKKFIKK